MTRFVADPYALKTKGNEIVDASRAFEENVNKIYQTINDMITKSYLDPAARAIADEIASYRDDLARMTKVINDYGTFCINASNKVITNQDNIISGIRG